MCDGATENHSNTVEEPQGGQVLGEVRKSISCRDFFCEKQN